MKEIKRVFDRHPQLRPLLANDKYTNLFFSFAQDKGLVLRGSGKRPMKFI